MSERWVYEVAGLRVAAGLRLPEWDIFAAQDTEPCDVTISVLPSGNEDVIAAPEQISATEHRFSLPAIGHFLVQDGRHITVEPDKRAGAAELRLGLLGSAWGSLCYQRGVVLLHGSAVLVQDSLVAFSGPAGAGKSSITAATTQAGGTFWADDHLWLDLSAGQVRVHRGAPRLKLWRDTLAALGVAHETLPRDHYRMDKYHASPTDLRGQFPHSTRPLPLRHLLLLDWGDPAIERLTGMAALQALLAHACYRLAWIPAMGRAQWYWDACADVVRRVPVWRLVRPRNLAAMDEVVERVARHVRDMAPATTTEAPR